MRAHSGYIKKDIRGLIMDIKSLKLKGFRFCNVFETVLFGILITFGIAMSFSYQNLYLEVIIISGSITVFCTILFTLEMIGLAKINLHKGQTERTIYPKNIIFSLFASFFFFLALIAGQVTLIVFAITSSFQVGYYIALGLIAVELLPLFSIILGVKAIKQINANNGVKPKKSLKKSPQSISEGNSNCALEEVKNEIDTEAQYEEKIKNRFAKPVELLTLKDINSKTHSDLLTDIIMMGMFNYTTISETLKKHLDKDNKTVTLKLGENTLDYKIIMKESYRGSFYLLTFNEVKNSIMVVRLDNTDDLSDQTYTYIFSNKVDPVYDLILKHYVLAKKGTMYGIYHKVLQVNGTINTPFENDVTLPPEDLLIPPELKREKASKIKKGKDLPKPLRIILKILKYILFIYFVIIVIVILFLIDCLAQTDFAQGVAAGFFGHESITKVETSDGTQYNLKFSNGNYYDEDGHMWTKDGDDFYRE